MVRIQVATGMRPSEVCKMRPCDIDLSREDAWIYRPILPPESTQDCTPRQDQSRTDCR